MFQFSPEILVLHVLGLVSNMTTSSPIWLFEHKFKLNKIQDGGPVVKNLPYNAGDMGLIPGLGTKIPHALEPLIPWATTTEAHALEPMLFHKRSPCTTTREKPLQLEKAHM